MNASIVYRFISLLLFLSNLENSSASFPSRALKDFQFNLFMILIYWLETNITKIKHGDAWPKEEYKSNSLISFCVSLTD